MSQKAFETVLLTDLAFDSESLKHLAFDSESLKHLEFEKALLTVFYLAFLTQMKELLRDSESY